MALVVAAFATGLCCGQILTSFGVVLPEKSALCSLASLGPFAVSTPEALGIPRPLSNYLAPNNTPTPLTATFEQGFGTAIACTTHSSGTSIVRSISKLDLLPWSTFVVCLRQKTYVRNQGKTEGRQKLFCVVCHSGGTVMVETMTSETVTSLVPASRFPSWRQLSAGQQRANFV